MNKEFKPYRVHLICNAKYHDSDFARLELLKLLSEHDDISVTVSDNYTNFEDHIGKDLVITYTCDLKPEDREVEHIEHFLTKGGNWFALHGTNAIVAFDGAKADTPNVSPEFMKLLGSRFIAHPANMDFLVRIKDKEHQLTKGLEDFEVYEVGVGQLQKPQILQIELVLMKAFIHGNSILKILIFLIFLEWLPPSPFFSGGAAFVKGHHF